MSKIAPMAIQLLLSLNERLDSTNECAIYLLT